MINAKGKSVLQVDVSRKDKALIACLGKISYFIAPMAKFTSAKYRLTVANQYL